MFVRLLLLLLANNKYSVTERSCAVKNYTSIRNESYKKRRSKYVATEQFCNWFSVVGCNYEVRPLITYFTDENTSTTKSKNNRN